MIRKPYKRKPDNHSGEGGKAEKSTWDLVDCPNTRMYFAGFWCCPGQAEMDTVCCLSEEDVVWAARHWPRNQHRAGSWTERERSGCSSQWGTVTFPGSSEVQWLQITVMGGQLASASSQHQPKAASVKE